jgi:uncharacterized membrane protein YkoI
MHHQPNRLVAIALALGLAFAAPGFAATSPDKDKKAAGKDAKAETKITQADAQKTALGSIPGGSVQSAKLVTEKGRQVWSFDLKSTSSANMFNVQVDANTGRIVSKSVQRPSAAAKPQDKAKS